MPDLSNYQPTADAADTFGAEIVLTDGATGETLTVTAVVRPRGLTPRTQARLFKIGVAAKIAAASGTDLDDDVVADLDPATSAAIAELVSEWDVDYDGQPVDPADASPLPLSIRSSLLQGVQKAVEAAPKDS